MREIATQLGESYLSKDISCLISQQREIELTDKAHQIVMNQDTKEECPNLSGTVARSRTVNFGNDRAVCDGRTGKKDRPEEVGNPVDPAKPYIKPDKVHLSRLVMLNIVELLLNEYSLDELRFINFVQPVSAIQQILMSNYFQAERYFESLNLLG